MSELFGSHEALDKMTNGIREYINNSDQIKCNKEEEDINEED